MFEKITKRKIIYWLFFDPKTPTCPRTFLRPEMYKIISFSRRTSVSVALSVSFAEDIFFNVAWLILWSVYCANIFTACFHCADQTQRRSLLWIHKAHFMWQVYCYYRIEFYCCTRSLSVCQSSSKSQSLFVWVRIITFMNGAFDFCWVQCSSYILSVLNEDSKAVIHCNYHLLFCFTVHY